MLRIAPVLLFASSGLAGEPADLFNGFAPGWREQWKEQRLFAQPTRYSTVLVDGGTVLHAVSNAANAGLVRPLRRRIPAEAGLGWRWKILAPLAANPGERTRAGDDYAARVFVVFETSLLPLRTRAINYVWAAHEPAGSVFPSPYTKNVAMIVLRSGGALAGSWQQENRDILADYRSFFGQLPRELTAVAVLVDTDNTGLSAEAWFADLRLTTNPP